MYGGGLTHSDVMMDCSSTSSMNVSVHYGDMDMSTSTHCISEVRRVGSGRAAGRAGRGVGGACNATKRRGKPGWSWR